MVTIIGRDIPLYTREGKQLVPLYHRTEFTNEWRFTTKEDVDYRVEQFPNAWIVERYEPAAKQWTVMASGIEAFLTYHNRALAAW